MSSRTSKVTLLFFISAGLSVLFCGDEIRRMTDDFPVCVFYAHTGKLCPACGNTRSVLALMELDYGAAVGYNPAPPFLLVLAGAVFAENAAGLFGYRLRLIPRGEFFPVVCAAVFLLYYVLRNIFPFMTLC